MLQWLENTTVIANALLQKQPPHRVASQHVLKTPRGPQNKQVFHDKNLWEKMWFLTVHVLIFFLFGLWFC